MIEENILLYLFRNKKCPLPTVGTLELVDGNATAWHAEHKMMAPVPFILFSHTESDPEGLVRFIASENSLSHSSASDRLIEFCDRLNRLEEGEEFELMSVGTFFGEPGGKPGFRQLPLPLEFFPEVPLKRVVRNDAVHAMRVGDTETDSLQMAEYFQEQANVPRDRWWIWAAAIFILSAGLVVAYLSDTGKQTSFGNAGKIETRQEPVTYTKGD